MSNDKTKEALPFLLSDEQIARMSGDPIAAQAVSSYEFGKVIGMGRGLASARSLYEQARQQDKDRIEELEALVEAAQAVVDRWDTPLWKDVAHTGSFIGRLRDALSPYTKPIER